MIAQDALAFVPSLLVVTEDNETRFRLDQRPADDEAVSEGAMVLTLLAVFGGLGFVLGRRVIVVLVFLSPIAIFWIWFEMNHRGPDDDVTGPVAGIATFISCALVLMGVGARWLVYWIARLATREASPESRSRRF